MENPRDRYVRTHSTPQDEALGWIEKQTHIRTSYPQMLSGAVQGRFLTMLTEITSARKVLEIGAFTGYSAVCFALGLPSDGHVDSLEINDELEDLILEGWSRAGVSDKVSLHVGDARDWLREAASGDAADLYDIVYMDANKREYCEYYELVFPLLKQGGLILVDDVMQGGKVYEQPMPCDKQTTGISEFNETVASDPRVEVVMLPLRDGLSIIRKK